MKNHYVIAGGGRVGEEIARELDKLNKKFVIIEKDPAKVLKLRKKKYIVIEGDANDVESQILSKANIKEASVLIIAMPETEKNLLLTLMAKEIKPELDIYVRCDHPEFVSRLKKAGAKSVIVPEIVAANQFVKEMF
jgi:Trk K+ transport system NAD-binding subunit